MTGATAFNAGTIAVVIVAAAGLVRLHVQEFAARRAATAERSARSPRLASPTLPRPGDRATYRQRRADAVGKAISQHPGRWLHRFNR